MPSVRLFDFDYPIPYLLLLAGFAILFTFAIRGLVREAVDEFDRFVPDPRRHDARRVLTGVIAPGPTLTAPISGKPCVAWYLRLHSLEHRGGERPPSYNAGSSVPFSLTSDPDRVIELGDDLAAPRRFPFDASLRVHGAMDREEPLRSRLRDSPAFAEVLDRIRDPERNLRAHRLEELRLDVGAPCTLTGIVDEHPESGVLRVGDVLFVRDTPENTARVYRRVLIRSVAVRASVFVATLLFLCFLGPIANWLEARFF